MVSKVNHYRRLAARETKAARAAVTEPARRRHIDLASYYEHLASSAESAPKINFNG